MWVTVEHVVKFGDDRPRDLRDLGEKMRRRALPFSHALHAAPRAYDQQQNIGLSGQLSLPGGLKKKLQ